MGLVIQSTWASDIPAMFNSKHDVYLDLSGDLRESGDWQVGPLRNIEYLLDAVSFAIEPLSGLLAVGRARQYLQPPITCNNG